MQRRTCIVVDAGHFIRDGVDPQREHEHLGMDEPDRKHQTYPGYRWVVFHPDLLGGRPTVIGTRISLSQVLECLSIGMTAQEIAEDYPGFPVESVPEVLRFAAAHVAA